MSEDELRAAVLSALSEVAPEVDVAHLDHAADLREAIELDSMDFLNLAIAVRATTGIEVPEADYPRLSSIDDWVAYLARHTDRARAPAHPAR
jgi:acyl carrier protein